jgi:hypothetical protein
MDVIVQAGDVRVVSIDAPSEAAVVSTEEAKPEPGDEPRSEDPPAVVHLPPPESGAETHGIKPPPVPSWIAFGVAGTAILVAGSFGAITLGAKSTFDDNPTQANADAFYRDRLTANIALAIGAAAAGAGLLYWAYGPNEKPGDPAAALFLAPGPNGGALVGRFRY